MEAIEAQRVQLPTSGLRRGVLPAACVRQTQGINCTKFALHYVRRAWRADGSGCTVDYGVIEVRPRTYLPESLDDAIVEGLCQVFSAVGLTLIDAGWRTEAVRTACRRRGLDYFKPAHFGEFPQSDRREWHPLAAEEVALNGPAWERREDAMWAEQRMALFDDEDAGKSHFVFRKHISGSSYQNHFRTASLLATAANAILSRQ